MADTSASFDDTNIPWARPLEAARVIADLAFESYVRRRWHQIPSQASSSFTYTQMRHLYSATVRHHFATLGPATAATTTVVDVMTAAKTDPYVQCILASTDAVCIQQVDDILCRSLDQLADTDGFPDLFKRLTAALRNHFNVADGECDADHHRRGVQPTRVPTFNKTPRLQQSDANVAVPVLPWRQAFSFPKASVDNDGFKHIRHAAKQVYTFPSSGVYAIVRYFLFWRWQHLSSMPVEITTGTTSTPTADAALCAVSGWSRYVLEHTGPVHSLLSCRQWQQSKLHQQRPLCVQTATASSPSTTTSSSSSGVSVIPPPISGPSAAMLRTRSAAPAVEATPSSSAPIHVLVEFDDTEKQYVAYEPTQDESRHYAPNIAELLKALPTAVQRWRNLPALPTGPIIVHATAMRYTIYPALVS